MTIAPPIPEIQFDHENSRSKMNVKDTPVSEASCWLISLVFHIRASYQLPSPSFHDNRVSHSWDRSWPWKFKVKGKGQGYPSQRSIKLTHFLSVSHQGILSTPVPLVPWQSGLPFLRYNLTLKIQGQRSRSKVNLWEKKTLQKKKKLASGVFPESWKVLAEWRRRRWQWRWRRRWQQRKRTENNKSPGYPEWLN